MTANRLITAVSTTAWAAILSVGCSSPPPGPAPIEPLALGSSASFPGLLASALVFIAADADADGAVTREELAGAVRGWLAAVDAAPGAAVTAGDLAPVLDAAMPISGLATAADTDGGRQATTPDPRTVVAMRGALPGCAPAEPRQPRRVLVLARAAGFVHSSIPLAAVTIEALGTQTGAWTTTVTYDAADVTTANLAAYDAVFLASTTGAFLDDTDDAAATAERKKALLDFVRGGKGLAGIHAATDSYRRSTATHPGGGTGGNPFTAFQVGATLAPVMIKQGDGNGDGRLDRAEAERLAATWWATLDTTGTGRLLRSEFAYLALLLGQPALADAPAAAEGPDRQEGTWPEFNRLIGGYFKFHWLDPQLVTVKVDDPASPLTAMFDGPFEIRDEIYTMGVDSWSRANVRVLTSIDYDAMSPADRALEDHPRPDRDYGLSWIRAEGRGRVFYQALGHSERIYANAAILEHLLAGMQYVLGDLAADDAPSEP